MEQEDKLPISLTIRAHAPQKWSSRCQVDHAVHMCSKTPERAVLEAVQGGGTLAVKCQAAHICDVDVHSEQRRFAAARWNALPAVVVRQRILLLLWRWCGA